MVYLAGRHASFRVPDKNDFMLRAFSMMQEKVDEVPWEDFWLQMSCLQPNIDTYELVETEDSPKKLLRQS